MGLPFRFAPLFPCLFAVGCAATPSTDEGIDADEAAVTAGPATALVDATGATETRVRAGGMTIWVDSVAKPRRVGTDLWITMRLRASRSLDNAMSFVPDDAFGAARLVSPRIVEIDLRGGQEIDSIASGVPLFVHLHTASGDVRDYEARIDLVPRFARFAGSSAISIERDIRPVLVKSGQRNLRYRGKVSAVTASSMSVFTDDHADPTIAPRVTGAWQFDWTYDGLELAADIPSAPVHFAATAGTATKTKTAGIDFAVVRAGLTQESAYDVWPSPECTPAVASCIQAKPAGTTDFGDCGEYRPVSRCID
jgi:hypothetical protein